MLTDFPQNKLKYICEKCNIITNNKKDYNKHLMTAKHNKPLVFNKSLTKIPQSLTEISKDLVENSIFQCKHCNKTYNSRVGLWYHNKKCNSSIHEPIKLEMADEEYSEEHSEEHSEEKGYRAIPTNNEIIEILKVQMIENQELRKFMMEQQKQMIDQMMELASKSNVTNNTNTINSNTNCNNKSFNLNLFLNEQCKDALNINEFVDSIKMQLSDLEEFANIGYADGVSNIFVKGINALDIHKRPIHCSDSKREVLYIKNNDEWIKESDDKLLIKNAIKKVAFRNIKQINEWVKENPSCKDPRTKKYDKYNKIVMNAMSGVTEQEQKDNIDKIVKNVTKAVAIDKYALR